MNPQVPSPSSDKAREVRGKGVRMELDKLHMTRHMIATLRVALAVCVLTSCDQNLTVSATQGVLSSAKTVEAPAFAPAGGVYNNDVSVTMSTIPSRLLMSRPVRTAQHKL